MRSSPRLLVFLVFVVTSCQSVILTESQRLYAVQFEYNRVSKVALAYMQGGGSDPQFNSLIKQIDDRVYNSLKDAAVGTRSKDEVSNEILIDIRQIKRELGKRGIDL